MSEKPDAFGFRVPAGRGACASTCKKGPLGVRASKEAMIRGYSMPLEEGLELERRLNNSLRDTADFMEGATAFKEKRQPDYKGK